MPTTATGQDNITARFGTWRATMGLILIAALVGASPWPATAQQEGDFAGLVNIGGRSLYLECAGEGSPTVVLETGYRSPATVWTEDFIFPDSPRTMVFPALSKITRVCLYERPGVASVIDGDFTPSRSDPVPMPRDAASVVADLHHLLTTAGETGPYVLVGHSLGGLFVRLFAATYPDEVAGLVLVDAWYEGLEDRLTPVEWTSYVALNSAIPPEMAGYSDYETIDFNEASGTMRQAAEAVPLGDTPVIVLSHGLPFGLPEDQLGFSPVALELAWAGAQGDLATLVPGSTHLIATESAHYIQVEQPELVIDAVSQVVSAVRDSSP